MKKISVIGDSNSTSYLEEGNLTSMNRLYSFHLAEYGFEVIPMSFVSNNTQKIINRSHFFLKNANSKYFILQIGWIDSSPNQYPKWIKILVNLRIKGFKKILQKIILHYKNYYKKKYIPLIPINQFQKNLLQIIDLIRKFNVDSKIIFLTIPFSPDKKINNHRQEYNNIIIEASQNLNCSIINTYELTKNEQMLNNTGHFSEKAHKKIAQLIIEKLS